MTEPLALEDGDEQAAPAKQRWWQRQGALRDIASLATGSAVAQAITLGSMAFLGRLYSPHLFGLFSTTLGYATILGTVITLRLEMAIPLAKTDEEARDIARLVVRLATTVCVSLLALLAVFFVVPVPGIITRQMGDSFWVFPLCTWSISMFFMMRMYLSRLGKFTNVARSNTAGAVATAATQWGAGLIKPMSAGLTVGYAAGQVVATGLMMRAADLPLRGRIRWNLIKAWDQFPKWMLTPAVLNAISVGAVAPLVTMFYGSTFTGSFSNAQRLLAAPVALLGQAVASVFFVKLARMDRDNEDTSRVMLQAAGALGAASVPVFLPVVLFGPEIFTLVMGDKWFVSGQAASLLAPWIMINFVSSPLSSYATVKNRMRRLFLLALLEAGIRIPALAVGLWWGGPLVGTAAFALAGLLISSYWVFWVVTLSGASWARAVKVLLPSLIWITLGLLGAWVLRDAVPYWAYVVGGVLVVLVATAQSALALKRLRRV